MGRRDADRTGRAVFADHVAPTLILYLLLSEKIVAGITGGAVKG